MKLFRFLALALPLATLSVTLRGETVLQSKVDSLIRVFDNQKGTDALQTARLFFDILSAEDFLDPDEPLLPSENLPDRTLKALTWYWAGEWYFDCQEYERSMEYSLKALRLCPKPNPHLSKPSSSKVQGSSEPDPLLLLEADCSNLISILYFRKSDYPSSLEYARRTLKLGRQLNDISRITYSLNTLAGICLASRQPAEGEKYILEAIRLCQQENDSLKLAVRCGMAAEIYHGMGKFDKSLEFSKRAYEIDTATGRTDKAAIRLSQMAAAYLSLGDTLLSRDCLDNAIPVLKASGNLQSWAISRNLYGEILLYEGKSDEAAACFRDAISVFAPRRDSYNESRARLGLSKALMSSDPAQSALQMHRYSQLRDSLYDSQMNMGLNEMHARYRNNELLSERDRYKKRFNLIVIISAIALLAVTILLIILRRKSIEVPASSPSSIKPGSANVPGNPSASGISQSPGISNVPGIPHALETPSSASANDAKFIESLEFLVRQAMVSGKVDFEEIESKMFVSRTHLNRKVKSITGETTSDLVQRIRISTAKDLLRNSALPIWEVAQKCGINDAAYFSTLFKKSVGKTPAQYRNDGE